MLKALISLTPFIIWVPLFYLVLLSFPPPGPLVLLSPTQFCPSDKHFLTFPSLSFTQFSSLVLTGWSLIGRDVCHTDLGWLIAQRMLAPLNHLWSDGLYISLSTSMDAYGENSRSRTYQPWQSHIPVASSSLLFPLLLWWSGSAELQRACGGMDLTLHAVAQI
jgi:hypothetical protein